MRRRHLQLAAGALPPRPLPHMQVVSGDEGGTICMWNVQSGQREGGFSLHAKPAAAGGGGGSGPGSPVGAMLAPAAPPKLTAMAFDSNQRRLLTALDRGAVRVYNFNSGAVLREFVSREARRELTAVAFVPRPEPPAEREPEQQGQGPGAGSGDDAAEQGLCGGPAGSTAAGPAASASAAGCGSANLVLATGWGRSLCAWEEGEEAQSSRCRRFKGHASDVLCMAPLGRDIVATGEVASQRAQASRGLRPCTARGVCRVTGFN